MHRGSATFARPSLGDAARVAPVDKLSLVLVAVFGVTFLKEIVVELGGVALIATGAVLVRYKAYCSVLRSEQPKKGGQVASYLEVFDAFDGWKDRQKIEGIEECAS